MRRNVVSCLFSFVVIVLIMSLVEPAFAISKKQLRQKYQGKTFYLQHNLYYQRNVSWVNFMGIGKFIPIGTKVTIKKINKEEMIFTAEDYDQKFEFELEDCLPDIETVLDRTFGAAAPDVSKFSEIDRRGIKRAHIKKGMTRKGVFRAVGYPPDRYSPPFRSTVADNEDLKADELTYMKSRFDFMIVRFKDNVVVEIKD